MFMSESSVITPSISVIIPTRNGAATLAELLAMLSIQTVPIEEILVADSASDDATVEIAAQYGAVLLPVEPSSYDHGGTRTSIAQKAKGDILVFFTQDAIPKRRDSIEKLIQPLLLDSSIATSYGRQLPGFSADHFAVNLRVFNYPAEAAVRALKDKDKWGLKTVFTSNSFAGYRKSSLKNIGYFQDGLIFGEDTIAVGKLLLNGDKIAYVPEAVVYHSHNYSPLEEFRRYFDIGVLHASEKWLQETFGSAEGQGVKFIKHEIRSLVDTKNFSLFPELCCRIIFKYVGYTIGRRYKVLPKSLVPCLSMHKSWWNADTDLN